MKKIFFIAFVSLLLSNTRALAQITLDFTVDSSLYGYYFYPVKLSDNETKYVFLDEASNTFGIYNLDLSPFLTGIVPPANLFNSSFSRHVMYVTRSLFDCDSSNIEYLYASQDEPWQPLWIMRTDGTVLFRADSTQGPYCLGCPGGTTLLKPILETEEGTKLILMKSPGVGVRNISVYSLCGKLPVGIYDFKTEQTTSYIQAYPNPSSTELKFNINLPDNINEYDLIILSSQFQEIKSIKVKGSENLSLNVQGYGSGTYFYRLIGNGKSVETGRFILTK